MNERIPHGQGTYISDGQNWPNQTSLHILSSELVRVCCGIKKKLSNWKYRVGKGTSVHLLNFLILTVWCCLALADGVKQDVS